jgi:serine/threonine-protein kinase RsbW
VERILELSVPASPEYIAIVRLVIASLASSRRELADERLDDLKLAVSEACTNAIEAHHAVSSRQPVTVWVSEADDRLEVHVGDRGAGFDLATLPAHPPVTDPDRLNFERGLGIPLIRSLVDEVTFESSEQGTTVRMTMFGGPADMELSEVKAIEG